MPTSIHPPRSPAAEAVRSFQIEHDHGDFHGLINPAHFFTWFAACTHALLGRLGLDPEGLRVRHEGYVTPLVDARVSLLGPVQVGDRLDAHTRVTEIGESRFAITHRFFRGTMPICEGHELRLWATLHPLEPSRYIARVLPHDVVRALMGNVCWLV